MNMTSNCDVGHSAHQIQITTICHWMNLPMKFFCVRHCVAATEKYVLFVAYRKRELKMQGQLCFGS